MIVLPCQGSIKTFTLTNTLPDLSVYCRLLHFLQTMKRRACLTSHPLGNLIQRTLSVSQQGVWGPGGALEKSVAVKLVNEESNEGQVDFSYKLIRERFGRIYCFSAHFTSRKANLWNPHRSWWWWVNRTGLILVCECNVTIWDLLRKLLSLNNKVTVIDKQKRLKCLFRNKFKTSLAHIYI